MLKRSCLAAGLFLAVLTQPVSAQVAGYHFTYADLQKIFVQNNQYFVLDDEGFIDPTLNHLHFTSIDTTTGAFTGSLWAPTLLPPIPQQTVPVSGTITIYSDISDLGLSAGFGNSYAISFSWTLNGICQGQQAFYDGAIVFRGYQGAKMRGNLAGTITSYYSACGIGILPYSPQPVSGILTK
ncbi:MAG TPA: hypothetical protein VGV37_03150 [Aliidongia sp.]|uniref:hypothetical protein n=1 Tax=Aliidongia sp. TaxID=1914230 RepID=UPI002DDCD573|nr:hypothetical protein [Aliidongia sp.]HEV2673511.1 hypothetical protein [Aliidongia sp.]